MNPPQSKGPLYDEGYSDGYRDRGIEQLLADLRELGELREQDRLYLKTTLGTSLPFQVANLQD